MEGIASEIVDLYPEPVEKVKIDVNYQHVNRLIGVDIPKPIIHEILGALEMDIISDSDDMFTVAVPTNKSDVLREADVIEEILRIYGYNKVPIPEQVKTGLNVAPKPDPNEVKDAVGNYLALAV